MAKQSRGEDQRPGVRFWHAHITAQKRSGLSRAEYCRQNKLSYHAATYWNRKLSEPVKTQKTTLVTVTFTSGIKINSGPATGSVLKVILPNKIAIEVDDSFSPTTLTKLLTTLERR